jgi:hypothetical protein
MSTNPYALLLIITFIITCISYIIEIVYPIINEEYKTNILPMFILRYIHLLAFIYFISFLALFNYKTADAIIYITLAVLLSSSWKILECCIISYYELKHYNVDHTDYLTNYHPCIFVFFRDYQEIAISIMGIIMSITFYYILINNTIIPFSYKLLLGTIFTYLFIDNIIQTRIYNKNLQYPTSSDSFINKYL